MRASAAAAESVATVSLRLHCNVQYTIAAGRLTARFSSVRYQTYIVYTVTTILAVTRYVQPCTTQQQQQQREFLFVKMFSYFFLMPAAAAAAASTTTVEGTGCRELSRERVCVCESARQYRPRACARARRVAARYIPSCIRRPCARLFECGCARVGVWWVQSAASARRSIGSLETDYSIYGGARRNTAPTPSQKRCHHPKRSHDDRSIYDPLTALTNYPYPAGRKPPPQTPRNHRPRTAENKENF